MTNKQLEVRLRRLEAEVERLNSELAKTDETMYADRRDCAREAGDAEAGRVLLSVLVGVLVGSELVDPALLRECVDDRRRIGRLLPATEHALKEILAMLTDLERREHDPLP